MNQPNIILITTDQQRFDTCGPRAPAFMRTPHFDLLRDEGIRFDAAYADCPICVPARIGIMTGKQVFSHGMDVNGFSDSVMQRSGTLPSCLREAGYQTCAIGKMHFHPERNRHGFDEMILPADYYRRMARSGHPLQPMHHGLGQNELYPGMATVPENMTLTSWIAEQCVEYIRERRDPTVPFFLWCSFSKPHPPLDPPEPYYSMYRNCEIPAPIESEWSSGAGCPAYFERMRLRNGSDRIPPEIIREAKAAYYGLITQIDYNMGRIFAALQDLDLYNDAMILYTSDHGEMLGDHGTARKTFFYESSAHVPFVLRLPKRMANRRHGTVVKSPVTHADILPTLVAAAGGAPPVAADGQDLVAQARGLLEKPRKYLEAGAHKGRYHAITDGVWKYIYYPEGGCEQLFNLETDPCETRNLAGSADAALKRTEIKAELIGRLAARDSDSVAGDRFVVLPVEKNDPIEERNLSWPGFHTESYRFDIRH